MVHPSSAKCAVPTLSRSVIFAPVFVAAFTLSSWASAQEPAVAPAAVPAPNEAPPAPAMEPPPVQSPPPAARERLTLEDDYRAVPVIPRVKHGFYFRFGSGPSFVTLRGHGPSGSSASITDSGASGFIALGAAVAPGLVLAGTVQGVSFNSKFKGGPFADATVTSNGVTRTASRKAEGGFGTIGLLVDWYPDPASGWHTGLAPGLGVISLTNAADDSDLGGLNFGGSVFAGYDWHFARKWAIGWQLTVSGATTTKLKKDFDSPDSGYRLTPFSVGVQASLLYF